MKQVDIAIIGGGGAGLTAAIYAARGRRSTVVFEGLVTGGQISTTDAVENFPGFPDGINGFDLAQNMLKQAEKFGAELVYEAVESLTLLQDGSFELTVGAQHFRSRAVVFAAGASYNKLKVPGEDEFVGRGVSYCATCDGAFFRDVDTVVVGGGDAALDEGLFLTRFARSVRLIHRRDTLRASAVLQERARANTRFSFTWDTVVEAIHGRESVESVRLRNLKTGAASDMPTSAVFIFIGQTPNNHLLKDLAECDEGGHIVVDLAMRTTTPGLFVAGDVRTSAARQLISACGDGATAAISAEHYLSALEDRRPA
jgi:thioredoxin reductase (NADPH)